MTTVNLCDTPYMGCAIALHPHMVAQFQSYTHASFVRYLDLAGTKYLIVPIDLDVPDDLIQRYTPVFENQWVRVLLNGSAFPRVFYVPQFETTTHSQVVDVMQKGRWNHQPFDPHNLALIERPAPDDEWLTFDTSAQMFGEKLALLEYELVPGGTREEDTDSDWQLTTWWACQTPMSDDYALYVHFLDQNDQIVAQADHPLGEQTSAGYRLTRSWLCPALVRDVVSIPSHVLADPDAIRIAVGVWQPYTAERLTPEPGTLTIDDYGRVILGHASDLVSTLPASWNVSNFEGEEDRVSFDVDLAQGGIVVHSTNYSAGWSGYINGESVPVVRVDGFLQGMYQQFSFWPSELWRYSQLESLDHKIKQMFPTLEADVA